MKKYYFVCESCGTKSDYMSIKSYVRLSGGRKWVCKDCLPKEDLIERTEFAGGFIIKVEDF